LILADLRNLFVTGGAERLRMSVTLEHLLSLEDRPWPEMPGGRPLTLSGLSRLLRRFGIHSATVRDSSGVARGYRWEDVAAVFARYLPPRATVAATPPAVAVTSVTSEPAPRSVTDVAVTGGGLGQPLPPLEPTEPERCPRCGSDDLTWTAGGTVHERCPLAGAPA
jgi:hypothetical protein